MARGAAALQSPAATSVQPAPNSEVSTNYVSNHTQSSGIRVENHSPQGSLTATVSSNNVSNWNNGAAINFQVGDTNNVDASLSLIVTGNTITSPGASSQHGISCNFGADTNGTNAVCADFKTNNINLGAVPPNGGFDLRIRQRNGSTVRLPGYGGSNTDDAAVQSFEAGQNTLTATPPQNSFASHQVPPGGGFTGGV